MRAIGLFLILVLVSAVSAVAAEDDTKTLDRLFIEGVDAFKASEWNTAMERFNQVLQAEPDHTGALNYRAQVYIIRREFDKAMADIDRAIALEPKQHRFACTKGLIFEHLGNAEKALEWYTKALDLKGGFHADSLTGRIAVYISLGEYAKALDDCNWLAKHQKTASTAMLRGNVLLAMGNTEAAYWDYVAASRLERLNAKPILALGDFFLFHDVDLRQAIAYYTAAIEQFRDPPIARLRRGQAYTALEPPLFAAQALKDFTRYIELEPDEPDGYFERAQLYLGLDDRAKALADARAALERDPQNESSKKLLERITAGTAPSHQEAMNPSHPEEERP